MDEQSGFEVGPVLAPRRARLSRLAPLIPVVALVAIAWAGVSGPRGDQVTAQSPDPTAIAVRSQAGIESSAPVARGPQPVMPPTVIGLDVHRLDEVQPRRLGPDEVIALLGWYVATAITDCPPLAAIYRVSLPGARAGVDEWAYCQRSGVLYASPPDTLNSPARSSGLAAVRATIVVGVVMPPELEITGAHATQVIVVGRFVGAGDGCAQAGRCAPGLVVDYVGWTPGT